MYQIEMTSNEALKFLNSKAVCLTEEIIDIAERSNRFCFYSEPTWLNLVLDPCEEIPKHLETIDDLLDRVEILSGILKQALEIAEIAKKRREKVND